MSEHHRTTAELLVDEWLDLPEANTPEEEDALLRDLLDMITNALKAEGTVVEADLQLIMKDLAKTKDELAAARMQILELGHKLEDARKVQA